MVNILHLTDLHFGVERLNDATAVARRDIVLKNLLETISNTLIGDLKPDLIVISGDIGWAGKKEDYVLAKQWITTLLNNLNLNADDLIVCSGNHDIYRIESNVANRPPSVQKADNDLEVNKVHLLERYFQEFIEFCNELGINKLLVGSEQKCLFGITEKKGISFLVLNSSWFCRGNDDEGKLYIGKPHLEVLEANNQLLKISEYDDSQITVAVFHHPKESLADDEIHSRYGRMNVFDYLAERSHVMLCGHKHGECREPDRIANRAYLFGGGAAYSGNDYANNVTLIQIDVDERVARKTCLEFDTSKQNWIKKQNEFSYNLKKGKNKSVPDIEVPSLFSPATYENKLNLYPNPKAYFTGRDDEIHEFKKAIDNGNTLIAIDGPGGIGKTQYISYCIQKYIPKTKVIWYDCTVSSQFDTIISEAGYPELLKGVRKTVREKFSAFKDKIQENGLFLFLDNFQETNNSSVFNEFLHFVQDYLTGGHVIIIDRDDITKLNLTPKRIHIEGLKEKKLQYAKALINYSYNTIQISDEELNRLCDELRGYPLAIDFAIFLLSQGETSENIISKIVHDAEANEINERLLNAIFSRSDATLEEREFMRQFSAFTGSVSEEEVNSVISENVAKTAPKRLKKKNLLLYSNGKYEVHPLVREFCYKELADKETIHSKIADHFITQRKDTLNIFLEEKIFYHMLNAERWNDISKFVLEKGRTLIQQGQINLLFDIIQKLFSKNIINAVFNIFIGDIYQIRGEWEKAIVYFNLASGADEDEDEDEDEDFETAIEGIIRHGEILFRQSFIAESLILFEKGMNLSRQHNIKKSEARSLNDIGLVYDQYGEFGNAHSKFSEALKIRTELHESEGIADTINNIGNTYSWEGKFDDAIISYKRAKEIRESNKDFLGLAMALSNLGSGLSNQEFFDESIINYEESLKIYREVGDKFGIANALAGVARVYIAKGQNDTAIQKISESLVIHEEIGIESAVYKNSLIVLKLKLERKPIASIEKYLKTLDEYTKVGSKPNISLICSYIADTYITLNEMELSIQFLLKSISIDKEIGANFNYQKSLEKLNYIRSKLGKDKFRSIIEKVFRILLPGEQKFIDINFLVIPRSSNIVSTKQGRNDKCSCESGKKYKNCHGKHI